MDYLKQRQKNRRRLYSRASIAVLVLILLMLIRPTWNMYQKSREGERKRTQAETELNALNQRKQELQSDVEYIQSAHGFDQKIRDKFGVAKKGETMVVIIRDDKGKAVVTPPPEPGFFERIWARFRRLFGLQ